FNKRRCNTGDTNCTDTGAFSPATVQPVVEPINVLIALPPPPYNGSCAPPSACSIPLLVFRHGIGGGRADMLRIADKFNQNGIAVAAIDAAKHGDRSYCKASSECAAGASCVAIAALAGEGAAPQPAPGYARRGCQSTDLEGGAQRGRRHGGGRVRHLAGIHAADEPVADRPEHPAGHGRLSAVLGGGEDDPGSRGPGELRRPPAVEHPAEPAGESEWHRAAGGQGPAHAGRVLRPGAADSLELHSRLHRWNRAIARLPRFRRRRDLP